VTAADGVRLSTDVFLPGTAAPSPAILVRTPYGRTAPFLLRLAMRLNRAGLAVALQDCRGRNQSEGEPDWRREEDDGHSTLAWLGAQRWCSGRLGLLGLSISSLSLFPLAARRPPAGTDVGALANVMGAVDFRSLFYRDGALLLHWALPWLHAMSRRETTQTDWQGLPWRDLFSHLPLSEVDGDGLLDRGLWREILASPDGGAVWEGLDARACLAEVRVPTLHLSGWYDFMLPHTVAAYRTMAGGPTGPRAANRLIVGPWDHGSAFAGSAGGAGADGKMDLVEVLTAWFARWLGQGAENGTRESREAGRDVSLYVQGADQWVGSDGFPPEAGRRVSWYLAAAGAEAAPNGGGSLVTEAPRAPSESTFVYDPADPAPTAGGAIWPFEAAGLSPGRADQREVERRADVLVYSSPPLEEDLVAVGPVEVVLWASSSAPATDFTAKLVDVDAAGTPWVVQDGIVRLRPASAGAKPHAPRQLTIDLGVAGQCFRRGHRMRLEVSSSNFPKYDRNVNGAGLPGLLRQGATAEQRVYHGGERPSHIRLTALPAGWVEERRIDPAVALGLGQPSTGAGGGIANGARRALAALGRRVGETISSQTARPAGLLGLLVGKLLVLANRGINRWTVAALEIEPGDRVLELGFGPGFSIREVAKLAREGLVAGVDHSEVMVREARRRNASAIRRGRVDLRQGTVSELPFADGAFDKVLAVNSVQLWPRRVEVLREVCRVMRSGGRIALTFGQPTWVITEGAMKALGLQTVADLGAAGFREPRMEFRRLGRLHGFCAVARAQNAK
jgi:putative CocE/NonD family hydrolase